MTNNNTNKDTAGTDRGGRRLVGPLLRARVPLWVLGQLDALAANPQHAKAPSVSRADVVRDVLRAGLVVLSRQGVEAPGFNPGRAVREAKARGEPL